MKPTKETAEKLLAVVDSGLSSGLGSPEPGKMCIMAAVNYALGRPHSDSGLEDCIGVAVRAFDIQLNDSSWSSPAARAKGMRREAIAKLGSNQIDQREFVSRLALKTVRVILPPALRLAGLETNALECEKAGSLKDAYAAANAAYAAANAAANAAAADAAYAAYHAATNAAYYAAASAAYAAYYAAAASKRDEILTLSANLAVEVLTELQSPGVKWLYLCDRK